MKYNVGKVDRTIRLVAAILIAGAGIYFQSWWGLLALVPLATGSLRLSTLCATKNIYRLIARVEITTAKR